MLLEEAKEEVPYNLSESEDLKGLSSEEKKAYVEKAADLWSVRLDAYPLPSLMIKVIKSMKKNGVCEVKTTRIPKMKTNFPNEDIGLD